MSASSSPGRPSLRHADVRSSSSQAWLDELLTSAWRRDGRPGELDALMALAGQEQGSWNQVEIALTALLVHPNFLFRIEPEDFEEVRSTGRSNAPLRSLQVRSETGSWDARATP